MSERISKDGMQPGAHKEATAGRIRPAALSHSSFEPICRCTLNITVLVCGGTCSLVDRSQRTDGTCCRLFTRQQVPSNSHRSKNTRCHPTRKQTSCLWKPQIFFFVGVFKFHRLQRQEVREGVEELF